MFTIHPLRLCKALLRSITAAAVLLLLLLLLDQHRFAAGQGLAVSPEALSADAELVAQQFAVFEGAAELATNLGGRGRGGRGSTSNLGSSKSFRDTTEFLRLQVRSVTSHPHHAAAAVVA
uniref:Uncharacterized protein n=1 Tax=Tetradesmus obliquus TaxID=3088 RepID=A0A383VSA6_TETOB|eukprot:jgi/Sobl393_1/9111/SZX67276.1